MQFLHCLLKKLKLENRDIRLAIPSKASKVFTGCMNTNLDVKDLEAGGGN